MADRGINFRFSAVNSAKNAMASVMNGLRKVERQQRSVQALQPSWNRGLNANRRAVQQLGFQLTDFAVQVGGGQSAMLAFTQQGGQMLQFFGPFGAIMAALLAVFGSLAIAFTKSGRSLSELIGITGAVQTEFEGLLNTVKSLKEPMIDVLNVIVNNLDTLLIAAGLVAFFFAGKWVSAFVVARLVTLDLRMGILALAVSMRTIGPAATAAMVATSAFTGALRLLRTALIRLGIPALVIAAAYLIERFLTLRQAAGGWGEAMAMLGDLVMAVFEGMGNAGQGLGDILKGVALVIQAGFIGAFALIAKQWDFLINGMASVWNMLVGTKLGETLGIGEMERSTVGADMLASSADKAAKGVSSIAQGWGLVRNSMTGVETEWQKLKDVIGEPIDVRDWAGGGSGASDEGGDGGKSPVEKATEQAKKIQDAFKQTSDSISSSLSSSFKSLLDGSKSFAEAASDILGNIADRIIDLLMTPVFDGIAGSITGAIMGPMVNAGLGPAMRSYEGGGMTGAGVRAGGVDGRGGRFAVVHPDETVVDDRKGGSVGGDTVTVNQYITTPDAESFRRSQRQIARQAKGVLG